MCANCKRYWSERLVLKRTMFDVKTRKSWHVLWYFSLLSSHLIFSGSSFILTCNGDCGPHSNPQIDGGNDGDNSINLTELGKKPDNGGSRCSLIMRVSCFPSHKEFLLLVCFSVRNPQAESASHPVKPALM